MAENAQDLPDPDLLEKQVRDAFAERDYAGVILAINGRDGLSNDLKGSILQEAVAAQSLTVVRHIFEKAKIELSPEQGMMLLLTAANAQALDLCVYLAERNAENGVIRSDSCAILFTKFPESEHVRLAEALHAKAADAQDALDAMLYVAATDKKFAAIARLLDLGADPRAHNDKIMPALLVGAPKEAFGDKDAYLSLLGRYFSKFEGGSVIEDALLGLVASLAASGLQYPETVKIMLDHGADAWFGRCFAERRWQEKNFYSDAVPYLDFEIARGLMTQNARQRFETLFGENFRIADLRQEIDENGDTGLVLAARARVLDRVMAAAVREGPGSLAAEDLTRHSEKTGRSLLSLAIDRDDAQKVLDPSYWLATDAHIAQRLESSTNDDQRKNLDLQALAAALDRQRLKAGAARYRLKPGPGF